MARKTKGVSVEERAKISRRSLEPSDVLTRCGERVTQSVVIDNATKLVPMSLVKGPTNGNGPTQGQRKTQTRVGTHDLRVRSPLHYQLREKGYVFANVGRVALIYQYRVHY